MHEISCDFEVKPSSDLQHPLAVWISPSPNHLRVKLFFSLDPRQPTIGLLPEKHMAFINQCSKLLEVAWRACVLSAERWSHVVWGTHFIDVLEGVADWSRKRLWNGLQLSLAGWFFLFTNVQPKSKQPKQHGINRKLLIKCFWGNDKTSLWTYRFACVAQYLSSKFLKSCAGEKQFLS